VFCCRIRSPPEEEEHSSPERAIVPPSASLLRFAPSPLHVSFSEDEEVEAPAPFDVDGVGSGDEEAVKEEEVYHPLEVVQAGAAPPLSPAAKAALLQAARDTPAVTLEHPCEGMARWQAAVLEANGGPQHWHVE
jgi:hypothetical protein